MEGYRSVTRTIVWEILKGVDQISCLNSCFDMCCNKSRVIVNVWEEIEKRGEELCGRSTGKKKAGLESWW